MEEFVQVAKASELQPGQMKRVTVDRHRILLANVDGMFYALHDQCGHQKAALSKGKLEGEAVECPMHFSRFNVKTGKRINGPAWARMVQFREALRLIKRLGREPSAIFRVRYIRTEDVPSYEVRVDGKTVLVKL